MLFKQKINKIGPRRLFLTDGLGALLSAIMLGLVLAGFEKFFGMPRQALYPLAAIAGLFSLYSIGCFFTMPAQWRPYLRTIATANLVYCGLTAGVVVFRRHELSVPGFLYFIIEIIIVAMLAIIELQLAGSKTGGNNGVL